MNPSNGLLLPPIATASSPAHPNRKRSARWQTSADTNQLVRSGVVTTHLTGIIDNETSLDTLGVKTARIVVVNDERDAQRVHELEEMVAMLTQRMNDIENAGPTTHLVQRIRELEEEARHVSSSSAHSHNHSHHQDDTVEQLLKRVEDLEKSELDRSFDGQNNDLQQPFGSFKKSVSRRSVSFLGRRGSAGFGRAGGIGGSAKSHRGISESLTGMASRHVEGENNAAATPQGQFGANGYVFRDDSWDSLHETVFPFLEDWVCPLPRLVQRCYLAVATIAARSFLFGCCGRAVARGGRAMYVSGRRAVWDVVAEQVITHPRMLTNNPPPPTHTHIHTYTHTHTHAPTLTIRQTSNTHTLLYNGDK